jgi:hypothetical protein
MEPSKRLSHPGFGAFFKRPDLSILIKRGNNPDINTSGHELPVMDRLDPMLG